MIYLRCASVWVGATALAAVTGRWLLTPPTSTSGHAFEALLLRTCSWALAACLGWVWLATSAVVLDALRRRPRSRRGVPERLRRLVLAGCGLALAAGTAPALATPGPVHLQGPVVVVPAAPAAPASVVEVRAGDTLWAIASRHLPDDATAREVVAAWHRIYRHNRAVIGSDPDLLRPGQHLEVPR